MSDEPDKSAEQEASQAEQTPSVYTPTDNAELDSLQEDFEAKLRTISNLPEIQMRTAAIGEALKERAPDEAAWWIDQLLRGALWGKSPAIDAMMACSLWLIERRINDDYELFQSIFQAAHDDERESVLSILRDPPPHQQLPKGKQLPEPDLPIDRDVSRGERRSLARGNHRLLIERLLLDPDPRVISQLLTNPNLREQDVLIIASRRPNLPDILLEVVFNKRWYLRREVRFTVVMNPYTATGVSLKLLPTLGIHKLRKVRNSTHLHPTVESTAKMLVKLREDRTAPWRV